MLIPHLKLVVCFSITDNMVSIVKLFGHDTSIFSAVIDANISAVELNKDLQKISEWLNKSKMSFNPDLRKLNESNYPKIYFNNATVFGVNWQKHLKMYLDESLNFSYHIKEKIFKVACVVKIKLFFMD